MWFPSGIWPKVIPLLFLAVQVLVINSFNSSISEKFYILLSFPKKFFSGYRILDYVYYFKDVLLFPICIISQ